MDCWELRLHGDASGLVLPDGDDRARVMHHGELSTVIGRWTRTQLLDVLRVLDAADFDVDAIRRVSQAEVSGASRVLPETPAT
jgi:hypothetical protein